MPNFRVTTSNCWAYDFIRKQNLENVQNNVETAMTTQSNFYAPNSLNTSHHIPDPITKHILTKDPYQQPCEDQGI